MAAYHDHALYPVVSPSGTAPGRNGIPVAVVAIMLLLLLIVWGGMVVAVCAVCAAGGAADDDREKWYAELKGKEEPVAGPKKDAA